MNIRKSLFAAAGVAVMIGALAISAHAWTDSTNYLTFNAPVALPGVTLPAGTYAFRTPSESDRHVVQVLDRKAVKSYYMGVTRPVSRPRAGTDLMVTIGEAPAGQVKPIQAWFPIGMRDGHAFIYDR